MTARVVAVLAAVCLAAVPAALGQPDWPHLRGPNYDATSTETGLVTAWPETGPPVLWARDLGQGYSGFVAAADRIFTQFQTNRGQFVVALDPETGAEIWKQRVDLPWQPAGPYPGPYATPTWHAGRIYYSTPTGIVGCLDAADGREVWAVNVRKSFQAAGVEFGYAATPLVEDGRVILPVGGPDAGVVALNAADGAVLWKAGHDPASYCPAYPITLGGRRLIVAFLQNTLALHDPATGAQVWRQKLSSSYDEHSAWPLYAEPNLFVAAPFRVGGQLFRFSATDTGVTGKSVWVNKNLSNDVCSSALANGYVYGFDLYQLQSSPHRTSRGVFKCLELATGRVAWETEEVGQATVLLAVGKLLLLNDTGTLIVARASPERYEELARARVLDGICWTPPLLWRKRLFVRNAKQAMCLYLGPPTALDPNRPLATVAMTSSAFDWANILPREPEYPHDEPAVGELVVWFAWCVGGVFGVALVIGGATWLLAKLRRSLRPGLWFRVVFVVAAAGLGVVGTTLFSRWADTFVLTWPAALYVAFRLTVAASRWAGSRPLTLRTRLASGPVTAAFLALCYGYYRLCTATGYVMAWGFLIGFLPAAPAAALADRCKNRWVRLGVEGLGFTIYFWTSGLFPGWKARLSE
ncbi:PQQ-binding-like beta-propeller repeat protein [Fimbriiglobus ruber]|uniref:Pyrrolo-quinoline quinone repeat domain-containing protein n=1 Tax=Fimbriiglobus ruber TaxID=1908690 RepID=A0A225E0Z3_9BACT|nr:PQQ-binding-like beta-propeller repeat protein [Fimbriiglobus ruber]OWK44478.1 hypothetical protein FRUB_02410 [Fimbriiglobus ruber]